MAKTEMRTPTDPAEKVQSFGDTLGRAMQDLPTEATGKFLQALAGLDARESAELCGYIIELNEEKKFRVIEAMAGSATDGKRRFILNLRRKFNARQLPTQEALSASLRDGKLPKPENARARVREFAIAGSKHHSTHSILKITDESEPSNKTKKLAATTVVNRRLAFMSNKSKSVSTIVTGKEITDLGKSLYKATIGRDQSDLHLTELEKNAEQDSSGTNKPPVSPSVLDKPAIFSKRARPKSNWELMKDQESAEQRTKHEAPSSADANKMHVDIAATRGISAPSTISASDNASIRRWTKEQDDALRESVNFYGEKNWKAIAARVPGRTHAQCLQRWRKVLKPGLVKGHWSFEEDQILETLVKQGCNNWGQVSDQIPGRTPKQCRERWRNHLDPSINKGPYTPDEDAVILESQGRIGNKWSQIAAMLPGRTEDSVKIRFKSLKQNSARGIRQQQRSAALSAGWQKQISSPVAIQVPTAPMVSPPERITPTCTPQQPTLPQQQQQQIYMNTQYQQYQHQLQQQQQMVGMVDGSGYASAFNEMGLDFGMDNMDGIKREEQQMHMYPNQTGGFDMMQTSRGDPHVEELDDLVNTVKSISDELNFDFTFDNL